MDSKSDLTRSNVLQTNGSLGSGLSLPQRAVRRSGPLQATAGDPGIENVYKTILSVLLRDERELTTRQLAAVLSVYVSPDVQCVTDLARQLQTSRPTTTRIVDRLVEEKLVRRQSDRQDRRRVLIGRTQEGVRYVQMIAQAAINATAEELAPIETAA